MLARISWIRFRFDAMLDHKTTRWASLNRVLRMVTPLYFLFVFDLKSFGVSPGITPRVSNWVTLDAITHRTEIDIRKKLILINSNDFEFFIRYREKIYKMDDRFLKLPELCQEIILRELILKNDARNIRRAYENEPRFQATFELTWTRTFESLKVTPFWVIFGWFLGQNPIKWPSS